MAPYFLILFPLGAGIYAAIGAYNPRIDLRWGGRSGPPFEQRTPMSSRSRLAVAGYCWLFSLTVLVSFIFRGFLPIGIFLILIGMGVVACFYARDRDEFVGGDDDRGPEK